MWHYYGGAKDYKEESGWTGNIYHPNLRRPLHNLMLTTELMHASAAGL